ncbi:protein kinase superfamily protein [Abortiporus biennis]
MGLFRCHHVFRLRPPSIQPILINHLFSTSIHGNQAELTTASSASREEPLEKYRLGGYHPVDIGDTFCANRYKIVRKLGWGQYSTVWLAEDSSSKKRVAMKILTGDAGSGSTKLDEVPILERIKSARPNHPGLKNIAGMLDHFTHRGPNGRVVPINLIQRITYQVLSALVYLHEDCKIIHTDIKADNILISLKDPERRISEYLNQTPIHAQPPSHPSRYTPEYIYESQPLSTTLESFDRQEDIDVKLADFYFHPNPYRSMELRILGFHRSGIWEDQDHPVKVIQTPALRAPEVVLRAPWKTSADIWALASVIFNLYSSKWLFMPIPCEDPELTAEEDHIVQMITMLGDFPLDFIKSGKSSGEFFNLNDGSLLKLKIPPEFMTSLDAVIRVCPPRSTG